MLDQQTARPRPSTWRRPVRYAAAALLTIGYWAAFLVIATALLTGDYRPGFGPPASIWQVTAWGVCLGGALGFALGIALFRRLTRTRDGQFNDWRTLSDGEITIARRIFGNVIDYPRVRVYARGWTWLQPAHTAVAPDGNIYFNWADFKQDFSTNALDGAWLIHELVHVWQHQTGQWVLIRGIFERTYAYGKLDPVKPYARYLLEQQAAIVEDYFRITHDLPTRWGHANPVEYEAVIPFLPNPHS